MACTDSEVRKDGTRAPSGDDSSAAVSLAILPGGDGEDALLPECFMLKSTMEVTSDEEEEEDEGGVAEAESDAQTGEEKDPLIAAVATLLDVAIEESGFRIAEDLLAWSTSSVTNDAEGCSSCASDSEGEGDSCDVE